MNGRAGLFDHSHLAFWIIAGAVALILFATLNMPFLAEILQMTLPRSELLGVGLIVAGVSGGCLGAAKGLMLLRRRQRAV